MTLSTALDAASSGISVSSGQIALVSRNIARVGDSNATRKSVQVISDQGGVRLGNINRSANAALLKRLIEAHSSEAKQTAILAGLLNLTSTVGDVNGSSSPAVLVSKLRGALQEYSASPEQSASARSAVIAAKNLAAGLNSASAATQKVRSDADADIASSVERISAALSRFGEVNDKIVTGTRANTDTTDLQDTRDGILLELGDELGITTVSRPDNDLAIYTEAGVTLFDKTARNVTFNKTSIFTASTRGDTVYADGVAITAQGSVFSASSGKLAGLQALRDNLAITYQSQLDEIARTLITTFAERDQSATPTLPDAAGLFTSSGGAGIPPSGLIATGLASDIHVSASVDPDAGGNPARLRDGGISSSGAAPFVYNVAGGIGFSARLIELADTLTTSQTFHSGAGLASNGSLYAFASQSTGWINGVGKAASTDAAYRTTLKQKAAETLSNETGINLDQELSNVLALERSYQASAKLLATVEGLYQALFDVLK